MTNPLFAKILVATVILITVATVVVVCFRLPNFLKSNFKNYPKLGKIFWVVLVWYEFLTVLTGFVVITLAVLCTLPLI